MTAKKKDEEAQVEAAEQAQPTPEEQTPVEQAVETTAPVEETAPVVEPELPTADPSTAHVAYTEMPLDLAPPTIDVDDLVYGIICTECGRFIPDPMGDKLVASCGSCGGKVTRGLKRDIKEVVNATRASLGLNPLY